MVILNLFTFSHILNYILKHYKSITISSIIGFIVGSLGVVWPWKDTIYKKNDGGDFIFDSTGHKIIENYKRYIPELNSETYLAILYIVIGILIVLALEWYGQKTRKSNT